MGKALRNFAGLEDKYCDYKKAKVVIAPIPYEMTTTYIKGTANAPGAIIEASKNMELYDEELDEVIAELGISTLPFLKMANKPEVMIDKVKMHCLKILKEQKFPVVIGGEHSISVGFALALKQRYPDISVLHLDAHADMRNEYRGSKYNHACVMARIREQCNAISVGIRSLSLEEAKVIREKNYKILWAKDKTSIDEWVKEIIDYLSKNVYITIDVDVFDPSLIPATGTPEPGGLFWGEILDITRPVFKQKNVVGFDVVELCPNNIDKASDFTVAKLIYKMIGYKFLEAVNK